VKISGVENAFRLSERLYSGSQPEGPPAFAALQRLGIKTILTVDGARPDVAEAHRHGIRYVHVPVGYEGVTRSQAYQIVQAARSLPGPVFIHCHHGKHRGPTAAALCGIALEGWSTERAILWLKQAGTSPDYRGLYRTVEGFVAPSARELEDVPRDLPEQAETAALVERMVEIDARWDVLKAIRAAGFQTPVGHPDIDPPHEALLLVESFREAGRLEEVRSAGPDFEREMREAARRSDSLRAALQDYAKVPSESNRERASISFEAVNRACTSCHARDRDNGSVRRRTGRAARP
jgi:protein tyrosine phosphatase (PTP) superfamily phosphohydrolase (DUF442 family)